VVRSSGALPTYCDDARRRTRSLDLAVSFNPLSLATLGAGGVLWVVALVGVVRGKGMTRGQRWLTGAVLLAAPVAMAVALH
jgi:hypothetical protein